MTFPLQIGSTPLSLNTGLAYCWVPSMESANADGSSPVAGALLIPGPLQIPYSTIPALGGGASTDSTKAILSTGLVAAVAPGQCVMKMRTVAAMGIVRPTGMLLGVRYVTLGTGTLFINADTGVTINYAAGTLPEDQPVGQMRMLLSITDNVWYST